MVKVFAILPFLILANCVQQYKPPHAVGKQTEVVVVSEDVDYSAVDSIIKAALEHVIYTPTTENIFETKKITAKKLPEFRYRRNILIFGLIGEPVIDSTLAPDAIKKVMAGEDYIFGAPNLFIDDQCVLVIAAPTVYKLIEVVESNADLIFNYFAEGVRKSIKEALYKGGYQKEIADNLQAKYGFSISIPRGWVVASDEFGFVSFIRHFPDRIISIYWETCPKEKLNKEKAIAIRDKIGYKYYEGDKVDTLRTKFYWVSFHNMQAAKLDGIWQNDKKVMGGPFRTYILWSGGELYVIDMHIFAPGEKKWKWIQQLELICDTFKI
ncbi:MAG: DUF4837 family protein [bacterium]|nr:DUF4837 family protein [bacterium]